MTDYVLGFGPDYAMPKPAREALAGTPEFLDTFALKGEVVPLDNAMLKSVARIQAGPGSLADLDDAYPVNSVVALGRNAMGAMEQVKYSIAIGAEALGNSVISRDNIAIGDSALRNAQAETPDYVQTMTKGTRNIAIGGNAGHFASKTMGMVAIGRNVAHCVEAGDGLVAIGAGAMIGHAPIGLTGQIENDAPWGTAGASIRSVAVGMNALAGNQAVSNVAVGGDALSSVKRSDNNTVVGAGAFSVLETGIGYRGGVATTRNLTGTYTQVDTALTLTFPTPHGVEVGDWVYIRLLNGGSQTFQGDYAQARVSTIPNANTLSIVSPVSRNASGDSLLVWSESGTPASANNGSNVGVGAYVGSVATTGSQNALVGYKAAQAATSLSNVTAVGALALFNATAADSATAVGANALRNKIDGTTLTDAWVNITGLGANSRVSGPNQVQLGGPGTTAYAYGAVQDRSDARDKADIRDTELGLDFVESLHPVDFRWDMRDDYFDYDEDGNAIPVAKDGSRKRVRFHHGFIAQEVEATGARFGGLQHHEVNGGDDVYSIGYTELIAPLVKAVQELSAKVQEQASLIAELKGA